jgi:SAM-dependent methyltransferase
MEMDDDEFYRSAADYDLRYSYGRNVDVAFWVALRERLGARRVLELGCGTGRVTLPLARAGAADGVEIVGLDRSTAMLDGARAKLAAEPPAVRAAIRLVEGDMRAFSMAERFDLICIPFNTLGHLHTIDDQLACLATARRHLAPGGRFAVEVTHLSIEELHRAVAEPDRLWVDDLSTDPATGARLVRHLRRRYERDTQTADSHFVEERLTADGDLTVQTIDLRLHVYFPRELELLFRLAGYRVEVVYGDYAFGPFTEESAYLIMVGWPAGEAESGPTGPAGRRPNSANNLP